MFTYILWDALSEGEIFMCIAADLLLVVFPLLWLSQYFYIRYNKIGLSNMIFGEGNAWAQGKSVYLTDPIVFYSAFSLAAGIEVNKNLAKAFGWSKEKLDGRLVKLRKNQRGNGPLIEEDKFSEFKATYPKFILLGRLMWLLIWLLVGCAVLSTFYSS
jgi:hypothetical protein